jgi:diguanylate cyclase (GGDEF)-like protein
MHMMMHLQTSLDTEQLLRTFFNEIQHLVSVIGCDYVNSDAGLALHEGSVGKHRCSYQLTLNDENFGDITFSHRHRLPEKDLSLLESVMDTLIYPLRNSLTHRKAIASAMIDPLTGLSNRGAMAITLNREIDRSRRLDQDMSVLMVDIDGFKQLNDRYGHLAGDDVLRQVARLLEDCVRACDACFRFGGEEFLVLLSNSNLPLARQVAERVRQTIQNATRSPDPAKPVTVSVGLAHYENESDWPELVSRADKALYKAKEAGRNRVVASHVRNHEGEWV